MITEQRIRDLVDQYCLEEGVINYSVAFTNSKSYLGMCCADYSHYDYFGEAYDHTKSRFTFKFSTFFLKYSSDEEVLDTILHEIAHAVAGYRAKHGAEWKKVARRMGCNPRATANVSIPDEVKSSSYKWVGICPNGHKSFRNRLTQKIRNNSSCSTCSPTFNYTYKLDWTQQR